MESLMNEPCPESPDIIKAGSLYQYEENIEIHKNLNVSYLI